MTSSEREGGSGRQTEAAALLHHGCETLDKQMVALGFFFKEELEKLKPTLGECRRGVTASKANMINGVRLQRGCFHLLLLLEQTQR